MIVLRRFTLMVMCGLFAPLCALAQPAGLTVSPSIVYKPPGTPYCYTLYVPNGANMTLDVRYTDTQGHVEYEYGWPHLDANGTAYICTSASDNTGQYIYTGVRFANTGTFITVSAPIEVKDVPLQATGLTFNSNGGYAGIDSYTLYAANTSMTVELEYTINCTGPSCPIYTNTVSLNATGGYTHTLLHEQITGIYRFNRIRNAYRSDWVPVSTTYTVKPPKPTFLSISPTTVIPGRSSYTMTVGNGKNVLLDARYRFTPPGGTEGPETSLQYPFWLNPADSFSSTGQVTVSPETCNTLAGTYRYTWINNRDLSLPLYFDTTGISVNASVAVTPLEPPSFLYADPTVGPAGQSNLDVTIVGNNFCQASLSTSYPGLNVNAAPPLILGFNTIKARFSIAATAPVGNASVLITTPRGSVGFTFTIASASPPSVTGISPSGASAGSSVQATINGSNLAGATLSTNYTGLAIGNVSSTSAAVFAIFTLSQTANPGTATIIVNTIGGSTTVSFGVTQASGTPTGPASTKEYVYLADRVIAVETAALSTEPPTPPQQLAAQALNQTTVQLQWKAGTAAPNNNITAYQVKRAGTVIATLPASQLSYLDTGATPGATLTFTAVAKDNTIPVPLVSANSNTVTVATPQETIPPTAPTNVTLGCEPYEWYWACEATWTGSTDSGGSGLRGYQVDLFERGYGTVHLDGPISNSSVGFYAADLERVYVYAVDNAGNISAPGIWQP